MLPRLLIRQQVSLHVLQDRLLRQVVLDNVRHIRIQRLVVRHSCPKRIRQRHVACAVRIEQPRHPQNRISAKRQWIDKVVIYSPVDHVHPPQTARRTHVDDVVMRHQIAPLNQLDAHLPRQVSMFVISGIEHSRRQQHDIRFRSPFRCKRPQCSQQQLRILLDRPYVVAAKQLRKDPLHHPPVRQHVAHAARHPQIVFEHHKLAVLHPDQVRPANRDVHVSRHLQPNHLPPEVLAAIHHITRHHAFFEDPPLVIDVL